MPAVAAETRRFLVHPAHERAQGHIVADAEDFHDAALAYVERWSPAPDDGEEVSLIVCECETGHEQCFRIDLGTGDAEPCQ
jgi:uncharacterized protein DUF5961